MVDYRKNYTAQEALRQVADDLDFIRDTLEVGSNWLEAEDGSFYIHFARYPRVRIRVVMQPDLLFNRYLDVKYEIGFWQKIRTYTIGKLTEEEIRRDMTDLKRRVERETRDLAAFL